MGSKYNYMSKKVVAFEPFKEDMILELFDESNCPSSVFEIDEMEIDQLEVALDMREDDLGNIKIEIENNLKELKGNTNSSDVIRLKRLLKMNTQKKQQIKVEIRSIKNRIKMMEENYEMQEEAVA